MQHTKNISVISLVIANLVPLLGVLFWQWDLLLIILLYWSESLVVAFYNILKMFKVKGFWAVPHVLFFCLHFGGFMLAHLVFILALFNSPERTGSTLTLSDYSMYVKRIVPALACLFVSHGISYITNFIYKQEFLKESLGTLFDKPYRRIVLMHVTIIFGGSLTLYFGILKIFVILLVLLKLITDLHAHNRVHSSILEGQSRQ